MYADEQTRDDDDVCPTAGSMYLDLGLFLIIAFVLMIAVLSGW